MCVFMCVCSSPAFLIHPPTHLYIPEGPQRRVPIIPHKTALLGQLNSSSEHLSFQVARQGKHKPEQTHFQYCLFSSTKQENLPTLRLQTFS